LRQTTEAGELFGRRVREIREERGLTQRGIAELADIPQTHLSSIERGFKLPNLLTVVRLALALDCRVSDLTSVFDHADLRSLLPK
jgi:transcriptional regulator with XRE-family HTH domain